MQMSKPRIRVVLTPKHSEVLPRLQNNGLVYISADTEYKQLSLNFHINFALHFDDHRKLVSCFWCSNLHFLFGLRQYQITNFSLVPKTLFVNSKESPVVETVADILCVSCQLEFFNLAQWGLDAMSKFLLPSLEYILALCFQMKDTIWTHNVQIDFVLNILKVRFNPDLLEVKNPLRWFALQIFCLILKIL